MLNDQVYNLQTAVDSEFTVSLCLETIILEILEP